MAVVNEMHSLNSSSTARSISMLRGIALRMLHCVVTVLAAVFAAAAATV
jgi:hypothetical protein